MSKEYRKPRSDSKLDALKKEHRLELRDGLLGSWRYEDALVWLEDECGVSSSMAALSAFYRRHCKPLLKERRQLAALKAEAIGEDAGKANWDSAIIEQLKQFAFESLMSKEADFDKTEKLLRLFLKRKDQEADERKLTLAEEKAAQAKAALSAAVEGAKSGSVITEETIAKMEEAANLL